MLRPLRFPAIREPPLPAAHSTCGTAASIATAERPRRSAQPPGRGQDDPATLGAGFSHGVQHRREDHLLHSQRQRDRAAADREHAALGGIIPNQDLAALVAYLKTLQ